jgi:SAM-dependent methyltransferase
VTDDLGTLYSNEYFGELDPGSQRSANVLVPLLVDRLRPSSVVDVGCGSGTWLAAFLERGVTDVVGVDGSYVDLRRLRIPADHFVSANLEQPLDLERTFDLAISLEVAEHLPAASAEGFVESLTRLSSVVVFSAAIPGQGGAHHVNLRWPDYWATLFADRGYACLDCIRPLLWRNPDVEWWYAQNTLLYARRERADLTARAFAVDRSDDLPLRLVHPVVYEWYVDALAAAQHAPAGLDPAEDATPDATVSGDDAANGD